jgi:hypothetical protein
MDHSKSLLMVHFTPHDTTSPHPGESVWGLEVPSSNLGAPITRKPAQAGFSDWLSLTVRVKQLTCSMLAARES